MSFIRKFPDFLEAEIARIVRRPLYRRNEVSVSPPMSPKDFPITTTKNTVVAVSFDDKSYMVPYDRLDVGVWMAGTQRLLKPMAITHPNPVTARDLYDDFNKYLRLDILKEHIVDDPIDVGTGSVKFKLNNDNHWFIGEITVTVIACYKTVVGVVYDWDWDPIIDSRVATVAGATGKERVDAALITFGTDYTVQSAVLATIPAWDGAVSWVNMATADATKLATALKAVDGLPWQSSTALVPWNLNYAGVVYNGPSEGFSGMQYLQSIQSGDCLPRNYHRYVDMVDLTYTHVLVVMVNQNYGADNLSGTLIIHYGTKRDISGWTDVVKPPLHHWKLDGNLKNEIAGQPDLTFPFQFFDWSNGKKYAGYSGVQQPLGVSLPIKAGITLSFKIWRGNNALDYSGLFGDGSGADVKGGVNYNGGGYYYLSGASATWEAKTQVARHRVSEWHRITIVIDSATTYRIYFDDRLATIATMPASPIAAWTHFGKAAAVWRPQDAIADIRYYDYALNPKQVAALDVE